MKTFQYILLIIFTSLYLFPVELSFLPRGLNTKMIMALLGVIIFVFQQSMQNRGKVNKYLFLSFVFACFVSICGFIAVVLNNTNDFTYATYIISMCVWLGGAYFVLFFIRLFHSKITPEILIKYLVAVCVVQCALAIVIDSVPRVKHFVDGILVSEGFMGKVEHRMYGFGASLDVAGMRFSAILIAINYLLVKTKQSKWSVFLLISSYLFIAIVGNMIARTTTIGMAISLIYLLITKDLWNIYPSEQIGIVRRYLFLTLVIAVPLIILLYNTNRNFKSNLEFGFEGFISLIETGHWETHSNNMLKNMIVFPDNTKTWVIGDGYFNNPIKTDYYFTGINPTEFYKGTDIGYLRFIFYFGLIGTISFAIFFVMVTMGCCFNYPRYKVLFLLIVGLNFLIWVKVSSDLFSVLAMFLIMPALQTNESGVKEENKVDGELLLN